MSLRTPTSEIKAFSHGSFSVQLLADEHDGNLVFKMFYSSRELSGELKYEKIGPPFWKLLTLEDDELKKRAREYVSAGLEDLIEQYKRETKAKRTPAIDSKATYAILVEKTLNCFNDLMQEHEKESKRLADARHSE